MSACRSGMCLGDDLPTLHRLCRGTFTANAGEMEHSAEASCSCGCHEEGTALHEQVHGTGQCPAHAGGV